MAKKLLIVEDDHNIRRLLYDFLGPEGMGLDISESEELNDALRKCEAEKPDLVILDYNLSFNQVGWQVAREIKKDKNKYGLAKTIAISGTVNLNGDEFLDFKKTEFDLFMPKPFDLLELREEIKRLLSL